MSERDRWMGVFRDAYRYGSARKVAYVSSQAHAELRLVFGDDYSGGVLSVAQFKLKVVEREDCRPGWAYVVDAA